MAFNSSDVDKFCAGLALTPEQKTDWLNLANTTLEQGVAAGADVLEAEINAVKVANAKFRGQGAALAEPVHRAAIGQPYNAMFAEVGAVASPDFQMVLPIGYWFNRWYGDIIVTRTFCEMLVTNWKAKALGNRQPFLDTNHDELEANAWLADMEVRDDGLYVKWDWTERGRDLVAKRIYRYYSATLEQVMSVTTGKEIWPVLTAVALTNRPAMNTMPEAHLSDSHGAHGDPVRSPRGTPDADNTEDVMELNDVITFAKSAPDADKAKIALAVAPELGTLKAEVEGLRAANVQLSEQVKTMQSEQHAKRRTETIDKALAEGRILPKDKDAWVKRFDAAPDVITEIVEGLPKAVDLSEHGSAKGGEEKVVLSADERVVAAAFGQSDEEFLAGRPAKRG